MQHHAHIELNAAIDAALLAGARVEDLSDQFLSVVWPHLDGRYTMVLKNPLDPFYCSSKVAEIESYAPPVAAMADIADLRRERRSGS